jgi:hypothetical protein
MNIYTSSLYIYIYTYMYIYIFINSYVHIKLGEEYDFGECLVDDGILTISKDMETYR